MTTEYTYHEDGKMTVKASNFTQFSALVQSHVDMYPGKAKSFYELNVSARGSTAQVATGSSLLNLAADILAIPRAAGMTTSEYKDVQLYFDRHSVKATSPGVVATTSPSVASTGSVPADVTAVPQSTPVNIAPVLSVVSKPASLFTPVNLKHHSDRAGCFAIVAGSNAGKTQLVSTSTYLFNNPTVLSLMEPDSQNVALRYADNRVVFLSTAPEAIVGQKLATSILEGIINQIETMTSGSVLIIDSLSSLLFLSLPNFSIGKGGVSNGIFPILSSLSSAALSNDVTVFAIINPLSVSEVLDEESIEGSCSGVITKKTTYAVGDVPWVVRGRSTFKPFGLDRSQPISFTKFFGGDNSHAQSQAVGDPSWSYKYEFYAREIQE